MSWAGQNFEENLKRKVDRALELGASFLELQLIASKVLEESKAAYFRRLAQLCEVEGR